MKKVKQLLKLIIQFCIVAFALVGIVFAFVFLAIRFKWTDEEGTIDDRSQEYNEVYQQTIPAIIKLDPLQVDTTLVNYHAYSVDELTTQKAALLMESDTIDSYIERKQEQYCAIEAVHRVAPDLAWNMYRLYEETYAEYIIKRIEFAAKPYLEIEEPVIDVACKGELDGMEDRTAPTTLPHLSWTQNEEWSTIGSAIEADATVVNTVADQVGIEARLLTTPLAVEQLRLFHTQRALFKQFFQPLDILASATKTSWGVMSIKEATAIAIENHLTDVNSPYYLGQEYEHMLDFSTADTSGERYDRLTNEDDHYYNYLYGALYIKQLLTQWEKAGYSIHDRPEIVATLYNIGFNGSDPKAEPQVGGASITIGSTVYTFGSLGYEYYYSTLLMDEFPYSVGTVE